MQENQIESQKKQFIYDVILKEYDINKNQGIFAPDIDERFNVRKDIISINTDFIESSIEVDVPKEVTEEVLEQV
ncbi:hypothetical protein NBRC111894_4247 [Sporolactobacillus inulinus]|uniref:Uncharacterized protein n=1 Tax=Sporolactobacillus inulinus TaxID=2078 RepID=A0A4Y1ZI89_9BACL|nr:hypothetical protein [Sporolactobacillus inulinus]GAY78693.1 hypothetical protein NBRC111894_4247 [Sporolactobacillus inulinus]